MLAFVYIPQQILNRYRLSFTILTLLFLDLLCDTCRKLSMQYPALQFDTGPFIIHNAQISRANTPVGSVSLTLCEHIDS